MSDDPRKSNMTITHDVRAAVLADLRSQVEALPWIVHTAPAEEFVLRADVLALIDGGSESRGVPCPTT
jgi:hypothetical protein